jgi:hypothetical protein
MNAPTQSEMLETSQVHILTDAERAESLRKKLLSSRPDLLTPADRNIANAEHECRTLNGAEQACEKLMSNAANACSECLRRSGFTANDLKRPHPLDGK